MNRDEFLTLLQSKLREGGRPMRRCLKNGEVALYELKTCRCWACDKFEKECKPLEGER